MVAADQRPRGGVQVKAAPFVVHREAIQQEVVGRGMPARVRDAEAGAGVLLENVLRVSIIHHRRGDRRAVQRNGGDAESRLEADEGAARDRARPLHHDEAASARRKCVGGPGEGHVAERHRLPGERRVLDEVGGREDPGVLAVIGQLEHGAAREAGGAANRDASEIGQRQIAHEVHARWKVQRLPRLEREERALHCRRVVAGAVAHRSGWEAHPVAVAIWPVRLTGARDGGQYSGQGRRQQADCEHLVCGALSWQQPASFSQRSAAPRALLARARGRRGGAFDFRSAVQVQH